MDISDKINILPLDCEHNVEENTTSDDEIEISSGDEEENVETSNSEDTIKPSLVPQHVATIIDFDTTRVLKDDDLSNSNLSETNNN